VQMAIMQYWLEAGGLTKSLAGTSNAADRFVSATFLLEANPTAANFWGKLAEREHKPGAPVRKMELVGGKTNSGNTADKFMKPKLFDLASVGGKYDAIKK
jgi:hypothetical protein